MGFETVLLLGSVIFSIGLYGALSKRNAITVLMSLEIMFNGVNITAVAMSRYIVPFGLANNSNTVSDEIIQLVLTGQVFAIFIIHYLLYLVSILSDNIAIK